MNLATRLKKDGELAEPGGAGGNRVSEEGDSCVNASLFCVNSFFLFLEAKEYV